MKRLPAILAVWFAALAVPGSAEAQCTVSASSVNFGAYDVFAAAPRESSGSVSYNCLVALSVQITLSTGSSSSYAPRTLRQGAEVLQYNLYLDSGRTTVWGDGTAGTGFYSANVSLLDVGTTTMVPVYGRMPPRQDVTAGTYTDAITVTINF